MYTERETEILSLLY